jgi:hypothetical protein
MAAPGNTTSLYCRAVGGNFKKMDTNEIQKNIWRIADGIPFNLGNMTIYTTDSGKLLVTGWTNTIYFENLSRDNIVNELKELKQSFFELRSSFKELDDMILANDLKIEFHMAYDDSGKCGIGICSEINGEINWYID